MKRRWIVLFLAGALVLTFAWAIFLPKGRIQQELQQRLIEQKATPDLQLKGVTFSESAGDIKYWEIVSATSRLNRDTGQAQLQELNGLFFDSNKPALHFSAPTAEWNMKSKEISIQEPTGFEVTAYDRNDPQSAPQSPAALSFAAKKLRWSLDDQELRTDAGILFKRGPMTISAGKLEARVTLANALLTDEPVARMGGDATLTAKIFQLDAGNHILTASGEAEVKRLDIRVNSDVIQYRERDEVLAAIGRVRGQKGDLTLTAEEGSYSLPLHTLALRGSVLALYQNIRAQGDALLFNEKENSLTVLGHVLAHRDKDEFRGESAKIWLSSKRIEVKGKSRIEIDEP